jgi:glucose-1-phosphate adenylyltransferase
VSNSLISGGCVISGGEVKRCVLSHHVHVHEGSTVEDSVLLDGVTIGRRARVRKAIIDQDVVVPDEFAIGYDYEKDKTRFTISSGGVVVVPRGISLG